MAALFAERTPTFFFKWFYAWVLAESGKLDLAARLFDEFAAHDFAHPTNNAAWLWFKCGCAYLCHRLERPECVPSLRPALEPHADKFIVSGFGAAVVGPVEFYLGLLATTAGDWQQAEIHFTAAVAVQERIGAPALLARSQLEWGRMLLAQGQAKEPEQAHDLLRHARATAAEFGLAKIEQEATELLASP